MLNAWQQPHVAILGVIPNTMHLGTNQKVQLSCGSDTNRELSGTPGSHLDNYRSPAGDVTLLTKANTMIIVEGSRLLTGDVLDMS